MSEPTPPSRPNFVQNITWAQRILAGISGSMFLMALVTMVPWVENMFAPNYLFFLSTLRAAMAGTSLICGCFVGIPQIQRMVKWLFQFYEYYKKFAEFQRERENDTSD